MHNTWRGVEEIVDAMATVRPDDTQIPRLCMLLNDVPRLSERHSRFDKGDGKVQTLPGSFDEVDVFRIVSLFSDIIRLVQVTMVTSMVNGYVNIENVTIFQRPLIRNTMANDLIDRSACLP